ncbi:MAG: dipeptidase PepV [Acidaminococcaceae bacterium]|jgi:succinyl-diaminopimelate desuccinylase|nr:dipeptidase PepV [Acidaminococcaceae bacterium]
MEKILNELVEKNFTQQVTDTQTLLKINSELDEKGITPTAPFGPGPAEALKVMLEMGDKLGFTTHNYEHYAGHVQFGNTGKQVGLLGHLDVVPAKGNDWIVPPYSATIKDGKLYGRGTLDDKGPTMAVLYAMKAVMDSKLPVKNYVRLIVGTDEEVGMRGVSHYLTKEQPPDMGFSPDASFPIINGEKGILHGFFKFPLTQKDPHIATLFGGDRINVVPDRVEADVEGFTTETILEKIKELNLGEHFKVEGNHVVSLGLAVHAMMPQTGFNAAQNMFVLLSALLATDNSPLSKIIKGLHAMLKMETDGTSLGIACHDEISGPLTCNFAALELAADSLICKFDIRYPIEFHGQRFIDVLEEDAKKLGGEYIVLKNKEPLYVAKDKPFIKCLQDAYEEEIGTKAELMTTGGGTYCRSVANTVSFGPIFPGDPDLDHQSNEFVYLDKLQRMTKIYAQAIYKLMQL